MSSKDREDNGLALLLNMKGSKRSYQSVRNYVKKHSNAIPSYKSVTKAKDRCCPLFTTTESGCFVDVQSLIDETSTRLFEDEDILEKGAHYTLICKHGMDSTSGISNFHQKCNQPIHEDSIFTNTFVPLYLTKNDGKINVGKPSHVLNSAMQAFRI